MTRRVVIVGGGIAGASTAVALRDEGFDGEVVLFGDEPQLPYDRPLLSKDYLRGACTRDDLLVHSQSFYAERAIDVRVGERVTGIDTEDKVASTASGSVGYDALVLATGASSRLPGLAGCELAGVHTLRDLSDCDALRADAATARRAVVVGMGLIGCEAAASLREIGIAVTAIEPLPTPLHATVGAAVGHVIADIHREHGVHVLTGRSVEAIEGSGRVEAVTVNDGATYPCDLLILAVGAKPRTLLAEQARIAVDGGIVVDDAGRTSIPDIFAAGDVARWRDPGTQQLRGFEHWEHAREQGKRVARAILGLPALPPVTPWFWSDQYEDLKVQWAGSRERVTQSVIRGTLEARAFSMFHLDGDVVTGCLSVNRARDMRPARRLIADAVPVNSGQISDERYDLRRAASADARARVTEAV